MLRLIRRSHTGEIIHVWIINLAVTCQLLSCMYMYIVVSSCRWSQFAGALRTQVINEASLSLGISVVWRQSITSSYSHAVIWLVRVVTVGLQCSGITSLILYDVVHARLESSICHVQPLCSFLLWLAQHTSKMFFVFFFCCDRLYWQWSGTL